MPRDTPASKDAEKRYLERAGGGAWEREKPFSPASDETLADSVELLHDFAVALRLLQPGAADRIIDLGAGGGWCSDLLQRLNRRSIAVDISHDMLRVARQRPTRQPLPAVAGDLEHLPFVDGAFDKAICLNALHHVPNMGAAVREISRVLSADGVAVFSEPGRGHAETPKSVAATRDFGVLEQEVLIEPFVAACHAGGFADVRLFPIAYVIPEFDFSLDDWRAWKRLAATKRPFRAAEKMWRAGLELLGIGKQSVLFEEAFAIRLVRLLQHPVEGHPFIVASKRRGRHDTGAQHRASLVVERMPRQVRAGGVLTATVRATNAGAATWQGRSDGDSQVRLGAQLLDWNGRVLVRDHARANLESDVGCGESAVIEIRIDVPEREGNYLLKFDLVAEGLTWFEDTGSPVVIRPLSVTS